VSINLGGKYSLSTKDGMDPKAVAMEALEGKNHNRMEFSGTGKTPLDQRVSYRIKASSKRGLLLDEGRRGVLDEQSL